MTLFATLPPERASADPALRAAAELALEKRLIESKHPAVAIGINTFVGLYQGPTEQMLTDLAQAKMPGNQ